MTDETLPDAVQVEIPTDPPPAPTGVFPTQRLHKAQSEVQEILRTVLMTTPQGVNRIVKRTDMYVELLREELEEVGGELQIRVQFKDGALTVKSFNQLRAASLQLTN